jgi:thioesterase domain-containing protein
VTRRVVLLHTVSGLLPVFKELSGQLPSDIQVSNIVDESLLADALANGSLTPRITRRVVDHVISAQDSGAVAVLATCSSIGPAVELAAQMADIPVMRVDLPMVDAAIAAANERSGDRKPVIAVLATAASTMGPTLDLVQRQLAEAGLDAQVDSRLLPDAFMANASGDVARHDQLILEALHAASDIADAVILAQASMARAASVAASGGLSTPTFTSPELAMGRLSALLGAVRT